MIVLNLKVEIQCGEDFHRLTRITILGNDIVMKSVTINNSLSFGVQMEIKYAFLGREGEGEGVGEGDCHHTIRPSD